MSPAVLLVQEHLSVWGSETARVSAPGTVDSAAAFTNMITTS